MLQLYNWPGNVRELKNLIERMAIMLPDEVITAEHVPKPYNPRTHSVSSRKMEALLDVYQLKDARQMFEKHFIEHKLSQNDNNITRTAQSIGVERSYLHRRIKKLTQDER